MIRMTPACAGCATWCIKW